MNEFNITRRRSLGILASIPFIGIPFRESVLDTFEIRFHGFYEAVVVRRYASGRVEVFWLDPWLVDGPDSSGWRVAHGPHGSEMRFRYDENTMLIDFIKLVQPRIDIF